jgi:uncharacterized protein (TIGR00255 family)
MISSMTGFGKGSAQLNDLVVETEIKSLNSRFLDMSIKLPKALSNKEFEIRDLIKSNLMRGKISLSINLTKEGVDTKYSFLDTEGVKTAHDLLREIKQTTGVNEEITLNHILSFQNLFFSDNGFDAEENFEIVVQSIKHAIDDLKVMRRQEGTELKNDLIERSEKILDAVNKIEKASPDAVSEYFAKLKQRAKLLMEDISETENRLDMELALLAERYDITEECVRMKSHVKMFLDTLNNTSEAGRKLNFISQEMNREANTINSKSVSTQVSHYGIFIKEELEKIREQIQNIE